MYVDHLHFYVDDAPKWRDWLIRTLGFQRVTRKNPILNQQHTCTEVVKGGSIHWVLSSALTSQSPVVEFLKSHCPGVADVAFRVPDLEQAIALATAQGATILQPVTQTGSVKWGKIGFWRSLCHTLIESHEPLAETSQFFTAIDHLVINVPAGELEQTANRYEKILGFERQQKFSIETAKSGLHSQVLIHPQTGVQIPLNEPTSESSQIQEFLNLNQGAGVQHIALRTANLLEIMPQIKATGLKFLTVPLSYYTQLQARPDNFISESELKAIAHQEILVDWQDAATPALLLQTFTEPIFEQPTFFLELIERRDRAQGFGEGNFRALFEAIEREQMKRGSLR